MKLIAKVSDRLRVSLSGVAMFQYPTIQQMAQVIASLMPAAATPAYEEGSI